MQLGAGFKMGTVIPFIDHQPAPVRNHIKRLLDGHPLTCQYGYMRSLAGDHLPEDRDGFRFRGGHAALDLTATLAARFKDNSRELIAVRADLDRWLISAGQATRPPSSTEDDVQLARRLREAIYVIASGGESNMARETLNTVAAMPAAKPRLTPSGQLERHGSARNLLATIAREAIELLGSAECERIRQCDGDGCSLLFLDLSRTGERKWCSMSGCGNRAKARAFRKRRDREDDGAAGED
jgi:predicted RNA-binding Zn ribbon-like protein